MQIDDIIKKEFTKSFMGYDIHEVDLFLDQIIDQIEKYESERREMLTAMEFLLKEFEQMEKVSTITAKPLEMAEKTPIRVQRSSNGVTRVKKAEERTQTRETIVEEVETGTAAPDFSEDDFESIMDSVSSKTSYKAEATQDGAMQNHRAKSSEEKKQRKKVDSSATKDTTGKDRKSTARTEEKRVGEDNGR